MRVTLLNRPSAPGRRRRGGEPVPAAPAPAAGPTKPVKALSARGEAARRNHASRRARRDRAEGGPQDQALYRCGCGAAFKTAVTASVSCPHCGSSQAW